MKKLSYSIQQAMVMAFSLITLGVISSALILAYRLAMQEVRAVSIDYVSQLVSQVNAEIDRYMVYMEDVADVVSQNSAVRGWISNSSNISRAKLLVLEDTVQSQLSGIANTRKDITNIAVFTDPNHVVFDTRSKKLNLYANYKNTDWFKSAELGQKSAFITSSHVQNIVADRYSWVVTMSKSIPGSTANSQGTLMIDLNYSLINNLCQSVDMGKRGYIYVVDRNNSIIYHPHQQLIYSHIKSEYIPQSDDAQASPGASVGDRLYISNVSARTGWRVVGVAYQDEIFGQQSDIIRYYVAIFVVFLLIAIILSAIICKAITKPLKRLVDGMQDVQTGSLDTKIDLVGPKEVATLGYAFNEMTLRLKLLIEQREVALEQRRKSELKALQAQINPHFLYNTLDSIIWMAESNNTEEVVEMTSALARLFRSSISESRQMVPLAVEIANIRSYLTIQEMRYKEKLQFSIDIPRSLEGYVLPKLLLQPLVENAIYHGIKPMDQVGEIKVFAYGDGDNLVLQVSDNGVGMSQEQLEDVLTARRHKDDGGIGVRNVHERIKLTFGDSFGLAFESAAGKGTTVRAILPKMEEVAEL